MSNAPASDEQAIVHLMTTYGTDIRRLCLCLLNDPFLAEDAAQETFFKAWKHYAGFRKECSEKTWFRSVFAHADDEVREKEAELPPDYDPTVWNEVQALPETLKNALVLRFYEGLSLQEAAAALGTNINTLNTRVRKAKAILQANLKGWYFDEED